MKCAKKSSRPASVAANINVNINTSSDIKYIREKRENEKKMGFVRKSEVHFIEKKKKIGSDAKQLIT